MARIGTIKAMVTMETKIKAMVTKTQTTPTTLTMTKIMVFKDSIMDKILTTASQTVPNKMLAKEVKEMVVKEVKTMAKKGKIEVKEVEVKTTIKEVKTVVREDRIMAKTVAKMVREEVKEEAKTEVKIWTTKINSRMLGKNSMQLQEMMALLLEMRRNQP